MRRLDLNFAAPRPRWPLWVMLAAAALLAADAASSFFALRGELAELSRPPDLRRVRPAAESGLPESTQRELDNAQRILQELVLPWGQLFRGVESAIGNQAALLSVEPDASRGLVRITGEARNYPALIELMKRLESLQVLERVHLVSHEVREDLPQRPYHFALVGYWRANP